MPVTAHTAADIVTKAMIAAASKMTFALEEQDRDDLKQHIDDGVSPKSKKKAMFKAMFEEQPELARSKSAPTVLTTEKAVTFAKQPRLNRARSNPSDTTQSRFRMHISSAAIESPRAIRVARTRSLSTAAIDTWAKKTKVSHKGSGHSRDRSEKKCINGEEHRTDTKEFMREVLEEKWRKESGVKEDVRNRAATPGR